MELRLKTTLIIQPEDNRKAKLIRSSTDIGLGDVSSGHVVGVFVSIQSPADLDRAMAVLVSVPWLLVEISNNDNSTTGCWKMIPIQNLVANACPTGTKLAVCVHRQEDVLGLAQSLELGVDALCVAANAPDQLWQAVVQAQREQNAQQSDQKSDTTVVTASNHATAFQCPKIIPGQGCKLSMNDGCTISIMADCVCIDFVQLLQPTEGCWIGSSAKTMALVLSEALPSAFVPSHPFHVNAGPVHSYVVMADGKTTKYLCELQAGNQVLVYNCLTQTSRSVAVGRLKLELRPCVLVGLETTTISGSVDDDTTTSIEKTPNSMLGRFDAQVMLQQAETVRLGTTGGDFVGVLDLPTRLQRAMNQHETSTAADDDDHVQILLLGSDRPWNSYWAVV
ncbi:hypothetical protein ACA910_001640 [Epithemia clementina (nom. ined.)]